VRGVLGLGAVSSGALAYSLSGNSQAEALVVPAIVMGVLVFGVALYSRARSRQEWSAAWDEYAEREGARGRARMNTEQEIFSWAGTN
jgi:hypothetical protein